LWSNGVVREKKLSIEARLALVENDLLRLRKNVHKIANQSMKNAGALSQIHADIKEIRAFVTGTTKFFGFAKKNWKTALTFGCGIITAAGITNPTVGRMVEFTAKFFGIHP